jgi:hypothetical protein
MLTPFGGEHGAAQRGAARSAAEPGQHPQLLGLGMRDHPLPLRRRFQCLVRVHVVT